MNQFPNRRCYISVLAAFFLVTFATFAQAEEFIKTFDSVVQVEKDGTFIVTETITVRAEGRKIKRGIFRDFPIYFEGADGKKRKVGFKLLSVKRDGELDNSKIESLGDRLRIYIGRKDFFLPKGIYVYTINYETTRQVRFFDTHDEVYWNATGNFWDFTIKEATAKIRAPEGAAFEDADVFTGRVGSKEKAAKVARIAGKTLAKYRTTRSLRPGEGMTVWAKLPKGAINPPTETQLAGWFWQDNKSAIVGFIGLLLVVAYYFTTWWHIGRDPEGGPIVPRWDVSDDMSPAMVNYIHRKGLAGKGFDALSAALLNLAVKGFVTLDKEDGGYFGGDTLIVRTSDKKDDNQLPAGEAMALSHVGFSPTRELRVEKENGERVKSLQKAFASAMEREHRGKFYKHNTPAVLIGIGLSALVLIAMVWLGGFGDAFIGTMLSGGMSAGFVCYIIFQTVKNFFAAGGLANKVVTLVVAGFFTFSLISGGFLVIASSFEDLLTDANLLAIVVGIVVLNVLFYFLLGAPTRIGRKRMDEIEGLKTYLSLAESDRLNMADAPDFSQHYENMLPYAVALGVEKPWSNAFEAWLAASIAAGAVAASYSPRWYGGGNFSSGSLSDTMGDFTSSMQSGFSSAMPVPKSSSSGSGGGGFSGGGGGGGGGGGW